MAVTMALPLPSLVLALLDRSIRTLLAHSWLTMKNRSLSQRSQVVMGALIAIIAAVQLCLSIQSTLFPHDEVLKGRAMILSLSNPSKTAKGDDKLPDAKQMETTMNQVSLTNQDEKRQRISKRQMRRRKRLQHRRNAMTIPPTFNLEPKPMAKHDYPFSSPVLVLSLPKSGTTSLYRFFECGGLMSAHTYAKREDRDSEFRLGECLNQNFRADRPLLRGCRPELYHAYSDLGMIETKGDCFYPSIQALEQIARDYSNASLILSYRDDWFESASRWRDGELMQKWADNCPLFPSTTTNRTEWNAIYRQHQERIRDLVQRHSSLHFLEFHLKDPLAGQKLENFTGIAASCWTDCKPDVGCQSDTEKKREL